MDEIWVVYVESGGAKIEVKTEKGIFVSHLAIEKDRAVSVIGFVEKVLFCKLTENEIDSECDRLNDGDYRDELIQSPEYDEFLDSLDDVDEESEAHRRYAFL